jgi:uncharacterized protein (DUF924 family)
MKDIHYWIHQNQRSESLITLMKRFGRFPGRNTVLGRQSTKEELEWLASPECPGWAKSQMKA